MMFLCILYHVTVAAITAVYIFYQFTSTLIILKGLPMDQEIFNEA